MMECDQPKKPTFKKAFAVPKVKSEVENSGLQPKTHVDNVKDSNIEPSNPNEKVSCKNPDSQNQTDKENTPVSVAPKKTKTKKSLFQAPCTSEILVKQSSEVTENKHPIEFHPLQEKVYSDKVEERTKPKKIRKKKEVSDTPKETKPKKTKVKKEGDKPKKPSETVRISENEQNKDDDNTEQGKSDIQNLEEFVEKSDEIETKQEDEGNTEEVKKSENVIETKSEELCTKEEGEGNTDEVKKSENVTVPSLASKDATSTKSANSLTNEQYQEIFQAVLNRCNNTSVDEMYESLKKPEKPKPEAKFGAVIGTKKMLKEKKLKSKKTEENQVQVVPKLDDYNKDIDKCETEREPVNEDEESDIEMDETERKSEDGDCDVQMDEKERKTVDEDGQSDCEMDDDMKDTESENVEMNEEIKEEDTEMACEAISHLIPDEMINNLHSLSSTIEPNFQCVNEATPEGSEIEYKIPSCQKTPPPKKNKKSEKLSSNKKMKLAPKQLNFPIGTVDVNNEKITKKNEKSSKKSLKLDNSIGQVKSSKDKDHVTNEKMSKKDEKSSKKHLKMDNNIGQLKEKGKLKIDLPEIKEKSRRKELQERLDTREKLGTWVQCGNKECSRWRYLSDCEDPSAIPNVWTCKMNPDVKYNNCEAKEQEYDEDQHIFTTFAEGSVVWAKMTGFPWWPAMVEINPDTECFFTLLTSYSMYPSQYHVTFFDDKVSRAWVNSTSIRKFTGGKEDDEMNPKPSGKSGKGFASYSKDLSKAKNNALLALDMSVQDRLKNFNFAKRYKGTYGKVYQTDSSEETTKTKKSTKKRKKRKIDLVSSELIDSALEDSYKANEDDVLKGFEEVLDALDDDITDDYNADEDFDTSDEDDCKKDKTKIKRKKIADEDFDTSDEDDNEKDNTKIKREKIEKRRRKQRLSESKRGDNPLCKQQMFIVPNEEMVVPSIKLDSDIFTMEIDDANDDSHKFKHKEKKNETLCTTPKGKKNKVDVEVVKSDDEDNVTHPLQNISNNNLEEVNRSCDPHTNNESSVTNDNKDNYTDLDIDIRREEVFSLEQDEQRVPGEDSSPESEFNLEMSNPVDDKHQINVIVHTIAPDTVELAYDSDPMDIEE